MARTEERSGHAARVRCECGEWVDVPPEATNVECQCGAHFAVTVTRLTSPRDR